ncbi:hypothetical protein [Saccharibacillus kuerlensis]|uniref:Uncharacterized protein n=1 Tax=Saccharibacillus kuerlensis TaxID=459527 RepID=A0ABQ2L209_9BACL|nr:hypothetical protein [Saccharibacillus kuerlensis]GGN99985.1 hypothetical protein GCM10010969_20680 [Saccharibacillus kuerlensis]
MNLKFNDWRSDRELDEERLSLVYHSGSAHHPELDVLLRARMKMLSSLFRQMNGQAAAAKRYFGSLSLPTSEAVLPNGLQEWLHAYAEAEDTMPSRPFEDVLRLKESAGFLPDELDLYVICRTEENEYACYHVEENARVLQPCGRPWVVSLEEAFPPGLLTGTPQAIWFAAANLHRSHKLLGERGYRYSLLEAGRLTEKIQSCAPQSVSAAPIATFYDERVNEWLGLDGLYEAALSAIVMYEKE